LLVGPSSNQGPILFRDPTVSQDNGVSYPAWAVLGSNVLAHPGQIAEVGFIHLDAVRTGTAPKVGVLFGEIYKWSGCPQFDFLSKIVHDPPRLPESKTIYSNRYYTVQSKKPAWCRHMQIQISFGNDSALNELLSLTIFGAVHIERAEVPGR